MQDVLDAFRLEIDQQILVAAPIEKVFAALLDNLSVKMGPPGGDPMKLKLEPWPGGRWFRDLGNNQGHLWGHVQVIKPPTLLELCGPMFMSYPVSGHVQAKLTPEEKGVRLSLRHRALGMIEEPHRKGVVAGWQHILEGVRKDAEVH